MGVRLSPLMLVGLTCWLGLRRVLPYRKLFLLGSGFSFGMLVGLGFVVTSLRAMFMAVGSVLMCTRTMLMGGFLVAIIRRAACC